MLLEVLMWIGKLLPPYSAEVSSPSISPTLRDGAWTYTLPPSFSPSPSFPTFLHLIPN
jgi:hypothetical protein